MKNKTLQKTKVLALILSLVVVVLTGCASNTEAEDNIKQSSTQSTAQSNEKEQVTVRVGDQTVWNVVYFQYGKEKGLLDKFFDNDKYDITFEISSFASGPAENEAFAAGQLDFANMGDLPATTGSASGYGYKAIGAISKSKSIGALVAAKDSGIKSIADLKDRKVGVVFGGGLHYFAGKCLETVNLTYDDVDFINTGAETVTSLRAGQIEAAFITNEQAYQLESEGTAVIVADHIDGVIGIGEVCVSDDIINNYDGLATVLLKGFDKLYRYIGENSDDYLEFLSGLTGADTTSIKETWDKVEEYKVFSFDNQDIYSHANDLLEWIQEQELIENKDVTVDDIIDKSVAKEAGIA